MSTNHGTVFPSRIIVAQKFPRLGKGEWRTFTQPHQAAKWLAASAAAAPNSRPWARVEIFAGANPPGDVTQALEQAIAPVTAAAFPSRAKYLDALAACLKQALGAAMYERP